MEILENGDIRPLTAPQTDCPKPSKFKTAWPHAPSHLLDERSTYFVTASTYMKQHHFRGAGRLSVLHRGLLSVAREFGWKLEAWAVFSNHYHFVGRSPAEDATAESLEPMLKKLHSKMAIWVNKQDDARGRKVWHNFRDSKLSFMESYLVRLNYTHNNPVKHGLVHNAVEYPWCSASWFEQYATPAQRKTLSRMKTDRINVADDFEVSDDW